MNAEWTGLGLRTCPLVDSSWPGSSLLEQWFLIWSVDQKLMGYFIKGYMSDEYLPPVQLQWGTGC